MAEENTHEAETPTAQEPVKTFTQADVDILIQKRLERERRKYPTDEEMTAYRSWKDGQQTEQEKWNTLQRERDSARTELSTVQAELETIKREKYLTGKGVPTDYLDYYTFKIGKLVTEDKTFEQAAEEFLKENAPNKVRIDMTAPLNRGKPASATANDTMNALIRGACK